MFTLALAALVSVSALADDGDVEIAVTALPAPVTAAVLAKWPAASIDGAEQEGADYEVRFLDGGKRFEAKLDAAGTLLVTEAIIAVTEAPAEVQATLSGKYGKWTVTKVEAETTPATSTYEAHLARGEKGLEIEMDAKGVVLATEKTEVEDADEHEGHDDDKDDDDGDEH